jgi:inhibitor of KinA
LYSWLPTITNFKYQILSFKSIYSYIQSLMGLPHPYTIFPLGDSALTVDFGNIMNRSINEKVIALFHLLQRTSIEGVLDIIPAYSSLTVCYDIMRVHKPDPEKTVFETLAERIEHLTAKEGLTVNQAIRKLKVPVCYGGKYGPDLEMLAKQKSLSDSEVIQIHTSDIYYVYMVGFLPGFAYMGEVDERISLPRRREPRTRVPAGAVGIAGKQTGIYPMDSPGGWQIIGQTPMALFDKEKKEPVLFQAGDEVSFYSISEYEFEHYQSRRS